MDCPLKRTTDVNRDWLHIRVVVRLPGCFIFRKCFDNLLQKFGASSGLKGTDLAAAISYCIPEDQPLLVVLLVGIAREKFLKMSGQNKESERVGGIVITSELDRTPLREPDCRRDEEFSDASNRRSAAGVAEMESGHHKIPPESILYVLTGPTAVGKSELAMEWAETFGAEILSCDSTLIYRGMDIGTAKPAPSELARIRHWLVDVAEVDDPWDVTRYVEAATMAVSDIASRGKPALIAGGSGFYLKSFWAPTADTLEIPHDVRSRVAELESRGPAALLEELRRVSPESMDFIDAKNPRRVARALERCMSTGLDARQLRERMAAVPFPFYNMKRRIVVIDRDREELRRRIEQRVDRMLEAGLVEEVKQLAARGLMENRSASSAIGYQETLRYLRGEIDSATLRSEIITNTNRLVRKQRTWFRHQLPPHRAVNLSEGLPDVARLFDPSAPEEAQG